MLTKEQLSPRLSVIVPFHGESEEIQPCLEALSQSLHQSYELIVVDDACPVPLKAGSAIRLPVCSGPAAARNAGASKARGEILVFIDADIIVAPESLALFEDAVRKADVAAVQACYRYPGIGENLPTRFLDDFQEYKVRGLGTTDIRTLRGGCFAVNADAFRAVHGFDENYKTPNQEDSDLGWRLSEAGYKIVCVPEIRVLHQKHIPDLSFLCRRYFRLFTGMIKLKLRASLTSNRMRPENTMGRADQTWRPAASAAGLLAMIFSVFLFFFAPCIGLPLFFGGASAFVLSNLPFLRFTAIERGLQNTFISLLPLSLMYFTLLIAIPFALAEYSHRRY